MKDLWEIVRPTFFGLAGFALIIFIFVVVKTGIFHVVPNGTVAVDYVNIVVILLTTVTVIFTIAALALAFAGFYGYRNLKKSASDAVTRAIARQIDTAFKVGGPAFEEIKKEITGQDAALGAWLRNEIEREVTEQLAYRRPGLQVDEDDPADEGDGE